MERKKIGDFIGKSNNLNFLKFVAAILVIYSHSFSITGNQCDPLDALTNGNISFGGVAVVIFFFASGFFVTKSLLRIKNGKVFWKARMIRIYPAFIFVVFLSVFLMGPLISKYTLKEYFSFSETYLYMLYLVFVPRYNLPGVFEENFLAKIVNGSLWTLTLEVICYIGLYIAYKLKLLTTARLKKINILLIVIIGICFGLQPEKIYHYHSYIRPLFVFIVGMEYYIFRESISINLYGIAITFVASVVLLSTKKIDLWMVCVFPYLLSAWVFCDWQISEKIGMLGEFSYAIYLVAFPIQQIFVHYNPQIGVFGNTIGASIFSVLLGVVIYYWIEKRAVIYFKNRA